MEILQGGSQVGFHCWMQEFYIDYTIIPRVLEISPQASRLACEKDFEVKAYSIGAAAEQTRPPRLVKIAVVQNAIVRPTSDPIKEQV